MRTTLTIDDDVLEAALALAQASGRTLSAVFSELARRALQPRPLRRAADGLPRFDVPSTAPLIPGNRATEILAREGLEDRQPTSARRRSRGRSGR